MNGASSAFVGGLFALLVVIGVFLLIRRFWLWYWNLAAIRQLLADQLAATRELAEAVRVSNMILSNVAGQLRASTAGDTQPNQLTPELSANMPTAPSRTVCGDCGAVNPEGAERCQSCHRFLR